MRFYTLWVRHNQKGFIINRSHTHLFLGLALLLSPVLSFAYSDSQWDCRLASDGDTWDCSASTKPIAKKQPVNKPNDSDNDQPIVAEPTVKKAGPPPVPRVQLANAPTAKQSKSIVNKAPTATNNGSWDCQAGANGVWNCTQTAGSTTQPSSAQLASHDEDSAIAHTASDRSRNDALFQQMVKQLAVDPWDTCEVTTDSLRNSRTEIQQNRVNANVDIQADYAELIGKNDAKFSGDVAVTRADQLITADQVSFQNKQGIATASGDVFYQEKGFALHSDQAQLQLNQDTGQFKNNQFILESTHARGTTQSTELINRNITRSTNVSYTTCAPSKTDWELQARTLELNNETGRGTGRDVWVEVFDLPVLYTPYISFPIDDRRQSGVLAPTFGSSDTTGVDIAVPYYWNIAPDYDATITPRIMSDRGLMLGGEFRYLTSNSEGQVSAEILDDTTTHDLRGQFSLQNKTEFNPRLDADIDLNYISDDDYLEDFGNSLNIASNRYLISTAQLNYHADNWDLLTKVDNYDLIDNRLNDPIKPHRRLPQVVFNLHETPALGIAKVDMRNEFVHFDHSSDVTAQRIDLQPGISIPMRTASSFITPRLSLRYTDYRLSNQQIGVERDHTRTLPILSVDSGLFFERQLDMAGGMIQTLEPRAYYLYVPHKNQDGIPLFDTSEYDFSYNQLFRENRFSGADRVGDANQLTLAVTTRFIEPQSGTERLRASLGTIIYFDDLEVGLYEDSAPITKDSSDIIAELSAKLTDNWTARSALQYDPHAGSTQKATLGMHYQDEQDRVFNTTYRSRLETRTDGFGLADDIEQTDISFKWPITDSWSTVGRWNYSLEHKTALDTFLGFEKDTCCWRLRVIAREYVNDAFDEEPKQGIFFQFELKGLTSFGEKLDTFLEDGILGYQVPEQ